MFDNFFKYFTAMESTYLNVLKIFMVTYHHRDCKDLTNFESLFLKLTTLMDVSWNSDFGFSSSLRGLFHVWQLYSEEITHVVFLLFLSEVLAIQWLNDFPNRALRFLKQAIHSIARDILCIFSKRKCFFLCMNRQKSNKIS